MDDEFLMRPVAFNDVYFSTTYGNKGDVIDQEDLQCSRRWYFYPYRYSSGR